MPLIDAAELHAALAADVSGEVRFDRLSRALYSTDASVYQIVPLGVVLPKTEADIVATVRSLCASFACRSRPAAAAPRRPGRRSGPGVILDCSKHLHRVLEINAAERWARVQPGCVLDDLNLDSEAARPAVRPGHLDLEPGDHRRHDRQQLFRHALGHLRQDHRSCPRAEGRAGRRQHRSTSSRSTRRSWKPSVSSGPGGSLLSHRAVPGPEHAEEIDRRFPKILRRVGGYNLDLFQTPGERGASAP